MVPNGSGIPQNHGYLLFDSTFQNHMEFPWWRSLTVTEINPEVYHNPTPWVVGNPWVYPGISTNTLNVYL